jgi:excisionase family DNA binding protein
VRSIDKLLTVTEAAEEAGVTASTIYRWIHGGVLSLRYFNDGRQAVVKDELAKLVQRGENAALVQLFLQVAQTLGQAVALMPATARAFGAGWEDHVWPASKWEEVRLMAIKQSEAHRDVAPYVRRRGRPSRVPDYGHGRFSGRHE